MAPRLIGAMHSTLWSRWTTERRNQRRHANTCRCRLGCPRGPGAQDSIEHYACCPVVRDFGRRKLKLQPQQVNIHVFTISQPQQLDQRICYAGCACDLRDIPYSNFFIQAFDRMETFLFRGADGHDWTRKFLDTLFSTPHPSTGNASSPLFSPPFITPNTQRHHHSVDVLALRNRRVKSEANNNKTIGSPIDRSNPN